MVEDVSVPTFGNESPESSTFNTSLPLEGSLPLRVSKAAMPLTVPPVAGARLPTLNVGPGEQYLMVEFVRLEYDIEKAARKIYDVPELDDFLGTRLFEGR